ncbi:MAG TPA: hypothetical protein VGO62_18950, partial [Myxococcota bacterium]
KEVDGIAIADRASVERLMRDDLERRFGGANVDVKLSDPHSIDAWSKTDHFIRVFGELKVAGKYAGTLIVDANREHPRLLELQEPAPKVAAQPVWDRPIEIAPSTFYNPVSADDARLVRDNVGARQLLAASTATKLNVAGAQRTLVGDVVGAAAAYTGALYAWMGVINQPRDT